MASLEATVKLLQEYKQDHVLAFYDQLDQARKARLLDQIGEIDFGRMAELIRSHVLDARGVQTPANPTPAPTLPARPADEETARRYDSARKLGQQLIEAGRVAAMVVAGGAGTRLGFEGPKGCMPVTPVKRKSLFHVFAEQIRAASRRYGSTIPWYVMTSKANDATTRAFFAENEFFGLDGADVFFFSQGRMPAVGLDGRILLAEAGEIAWNPNGHGGSLAALRHSGALDDMAGRGVQYISYFQVDNPIIHCIDPLFIGLTDQAGAEMSAKALPKIGPLEKLGNFCLVDEKVTVIEYSDLPDELARAAKGDGTLLFHSGSIATHVFSRRFVERLTAGGQCGLPFHRALKKVSCVGPAGQTIHPDEPNAVKLEMFVFDAMPLAEKVVILDTIRSEEFSPVKNAHGQGSPDTCLRDQVGRAARWLESAGVRVPRDADNRPAAVIEISPLLALDAEELAARIDTGMIIKPGANVYLE